LFDLDSCHFDPSHANLDNSLIIQADTLYSIVAMLKG